VHELGAGHDTPSRDAVGASGFGVG
jgi:hypothetical protein